MHADFDIGSWTPARDLSEAGGWRFSLSRPDERELREFAWAKRASSS